MEVNVSGQIEVCVPLELPKGKKALKALCKKLGIELDSSRDDIAKALVLEAIRGGLDEMEYRQSEASSVDEMDLSVEES